MIQAIQWTGDNRDALIEASGRHPAPQPQVVHLRSTAGFFLLQQPATPDDLWLELFDWAIQQDTGVWQRFSPIEAALTYNLGKGMLL